MLSDVDVLLAYDFDRISRNQTHMAVILNDIMEADTQLYSVTAGLFDNTAIGKFMLNARTFAAEVEREKIAERTMRGKVAWATDGRYIGPAPYGYAKVYEANGAKGKKVGRLVIDHETARVVRRIYDLYLTGLGVRSISVALTNDGIPTPRKVGSWSGAMVRLILERDVYVGRGDWNGIEIEAPAIIDEETHTRVAVERAKRVRYPGGNASPLNILTGVLYCSECESRMQGDRTVARSKGRVYEYRTYICSRWHAGHGCVSNRHDAGELEHAVIDDLAREQSTEVARRKHRNDPSVQLRADLSDVERAFTKHAAERKHILDQIASGDLFGSMAKDAVTRIEAEHEHLSNEQRRLTEDLAALEARQRDAENRPNAIASLLETEDPAERKAILGRYVRKILCKPGDPEPVIVE